MINTKFKYYVECIMDYYVKITTHFNLITDKVDWYITDYDADYRLRNLVCNAIAIDL